MSAVHGRWENQDVWGGRRNIKKPEPLVRDVLHAFEKGPMETATQPEGLTVSMKDYQLQSLHWMLDKVQGCHDGCQGWLTHDGCAMQEAHGLIKEISVGVTTVDGQSVRYLPGLDSCVNLATDADCYGGFLCEEMG